MTATPKTVRDECASKRAAQPSRGRGDFTPSGFTIAFFGHDALESTVKKRVARFRSLRADVIGFMFRRIRSGPPNSIEWENVALGETTDKNYLRRLLKLAQGLAITIANRDQFRRCDAIFVRNVDMLLIAYFARIVLRSRAPLVYEALDIQHLFVGERPVNKVMRWVERRLLGVIDLLVVSSTDHIRFYFDEVQHYRGPWFLLENKISPEPLLERRIEKGVSKQEAPPWVVGWFGVVRGRRSLDILIGLAEALPDLVQIYIRGYASDPAIPQESLERICATHKNMIYGGPYSNPIDLPAIYGKTHVVWASDFLDAGANSTWCLTNRLYEGGVFGAPAVALDDSATGRWIRENGLGFTLKEPLEENIVAFFRELDAETYRSKQRQLKAVAASVFIDFNDTAALLLEMGRLRGA